MADGLKSVHNINKLIISDYRSKGLLESNNLALIQGRIESVEETGTYAGIEQHLVAVNTRKINGENNLTWVMLPKCEETAILVRKKAFVYIRGKLQASYSFNSKSRLHQFIVPDMVYELDKPVMIPKTGEHYLDFTFNNRVVLSGKIIEEPEVIVVNDFNLLKFKLRYSSNEITRNVSCTLWGFLHDIELHADDHIKVVSRFIIKPPKRGNPDYMYYSLLVQKVFLEDYTEVDKAKEIFV